MLVWDKIVEYKQYISNLWIWMHTSLYWGSINFGCMHLGAPACLSTLAILNCFVLVTFKILFIQCWFGTKLLSINNNNILVIYEYKCTHHYIDDLQCTATTFSTSNKSLSNSMLLLCKIFYKLVAIWTIFPPISVTIR